MKPREIRLMMFLLSVAIAAALWMFRERKEQLEQLYSKRLDMACEMMEESGE